MEGWFAEMGNARSLSILLILLGLALWAGRAGAMDISSTGSWSPTTGPSDLISGAGSELTDAYESDVDQVIIAISNTTGSTDNWRVDVRRSDTTWHNDFTISVRRMSAGTGNGLISGGATYQAVTTSDAAFFSGAGDRSNVKIQLRISGVSLAVSPDTYSTSIVYTVVDT